MFEVELKVRADHAEVRDRLNALGADGCEPVSQIDTYYDHPVRTFAETDEALRIRRESSHGEVETNVTYKGPLVEAASKTREEFETTVGDGETMNRILRKLGFEPAATVEKTRERFEHEGYTVTLDTVEGLGEFVEVERAVENEHIATARDGAIDLLDNLGLDADDQVRTSYLGLLLAME